MGEKGNGGAGYEGGEPRVGLIALSGGGFVVLVVAMVLGVQFYFDRVESQQVYTQQMLPVFDDLKNVRAKEDAALHSYQYVDRNAGVVRIPIERGMELLEREAAQGRLRYPRKPAAVVVTPPPGAPDAK